MKISKSLIAIIAIVVVLGIYAVSSYNSLVTSEEGVKEALANVNTQYQRRMDLITNLVETVKGYAKHESETLQKVIAERSKATQATINIENADENSLKEFQNAQGEISQALGRLMVVAEQYPELKADQSFLNLQEQLEGTENRISVERRKYNEIVKDYNITVRRFPKSIMAAIFGFDKFPSFTAEEGAEKAPKVSF